MGNESRTTGLNDRMLSELNSQINAELYSAYLYLSMCAWFEDQNLSGFATWMKAQATEEVTHAMKLFDYCADRGGRVVLDAIEKPQVEWGSPLEVFEAVYAHERHVTSLINGLVDTAIETGDHATRTMLDWFVSEQVEEEASADAVLQHLVMLEDAPAGLLYMLDREMGQRGQE